MARPITLRGFRVDKAGRIVRNERALSVSERLRRKASKRIRPRRGQMR
jgi:hypothetical protein